MTTNSARAWQTVRTLAAVRADRYAAVKLSDGSVHRSEVERLPERRDARLV